MLYADEMCEITDSRDVFRQLAGQPGLRKYRSVELAVNMPIYRLDVPFSQQHKNGHRPRRIIFDDLQEVLHFIDGEKNSPMIYLSQQTRFIEGEKSELRQIFSISSALDESGQEILIFNSDGGLFRAGYALDESVPIGISNIVQVWPSLL